MDKQREFLEKEEGPRVYVRFCKDVKCGGSVIMRPGIDERYFIGWCGKCREYHVERRR